jgi:hypothetical protein
MSVHTTASNVTCQGRHSGAKCARRPAVGPSGKSGWGLRCPTAYPVWTGHVEPGGQLLGQFAHAAVIMQCWDFELEHRQRDDDGKDAVAEGFQPVRRNSRWVKRVRNPIRSTLRSWRIARCGLCHAHRASHCAPRYGLGRRTVRNRAWPVCVRSKAS